MRLRAQTTRASSQATYASGLARFTHWAIEVGGLAPEDALPASPVATVMAKRVQLFIVWASKKYACTTIDSTISALAHWLKSMDIDPAEYVRTPEISATLQAARAEQGPAGVPTGKVGMSRHLLRLLLSYITSLEREQPDMVGLFHRDKAWLVLGYFGMLRRSEIIGFQMRDIQFLQAGGITYLELHIRKSKTDKLGQGATITITATSNDNIPIMTIVHRWYSHRRDMGAQPLDPLFTRWDLDNLCIGPESIHRGQTLAERLKVYLVALKQRYPELCVNPSSYGMHSLRRGGVLAAWLAGVDIEKIKSHGRWRSDAVRAYMQASLPIRMVITSTM